MGRAAGDRAGRRQRAGDAVADGRHAGQLRRVHARLTKTYLASTSGNVTSTAGDALLSVADPSSNATGRLVNGTFSLPQPLQARARNAANTGTAYNNVGSSASPLNLLTYSGPISNDALQSRVQSADQRQRCPAHGLVQQDADVHAVDDDSLAPRAPGAAATAAPGAQSPASNCRMRSISID